MKTAINQDIKTCEVCGHQGTDVHEWPTYKDGRDRTKYQCDDYKTCLTRKSNDNNTPNAIIWVEARCPICGLPYPYIQGGYKPATCNNFDCVQKYLHPELRRDN